MITPIKDILEIDKIIRNTIIEESEFEANRVLNAISVRGQNLSKLVEEGKIEAIGGNKNRTYVLRSWKISHARFDSAFYENNLKGMF